VPEIAQLVLLMASPNGSEGEDVQDVGVLPPRVGVIVVMAESSTKEKGDPE
jgi:hypothetical protein